MNNLSPTPAVSLTERAAARVTTLITEEGDDSLMLRLSVSGGGCSGFSYGFCLDSETTNDDKVFEFHRVKLVIDDMSLDLLGGSEIDYVDDLMAASFRINNPNASSTCGCGTSFSI
ncbi:MAG: iron-sulfur cluster insertion protein ErpA [Rhodospirillaceae bacterium]|jgi:iron-sulfur cluster insertion protein|nr:iron-sulfur cluster insertion protein ErpA [Rhodospirillaceae bacterium]